MPALFRICLTVSAMAMGLPGLAAAQSTTAFDGTYLGVSLQGSGSGRSCSPATSAPRPLTLSGGNARVVMGAQGDLVFQGTVDAHGVLTLRSGSGSLLSGRVDPGSYSMTWRKQ
jgi:hypothetical protein